MARTEVLPLIMLHPRPMDNKQTWIWLKMLILVLIFVSIFNPWNELHFRKSFYIYISW